MGWDGSGDGKEVGDKRGATVGGFHMLVVAFVVY